MKEIKSPLRAIRENCKECIGGEGYIKDCTSPKCKLFPFRFGKNPFTTRILTEDERKKLSDRARRVFSQHKSTRVKP